MGRSVDYLSRAQHVTFIHKQWEDTDFEWTDFIEDIGNVIDEIAPSLYPPNKDRWDGRETQIILENSHAEIGISEYCGLVSLSIRVYESDYTRQGLAAHWIDQMWPKIQAALNKSFTTLRKRGTFSNGEGVYEKITS